MTPCADWSICEDDCCRNNAPTAFSPLVAQTNYTGTWMAFSCTLNNADGSCDDSPVWNESPSAFICQGVETTLDNGASDLDGDSLVYELIDVPNGCNSGTITYNSPYSATYPLTTASGTFPFDAATGQSVFTPAYTPGIFEVTVIGVKIYSYRNGVLKGTITRDMQVLTMQGCDSLDAQYGGFSALGANTNLVNDLSLIHI